MLGWRGEGELQTGSLLVGGGDAQTMSAWSNQDISDRDQFYEEARTQLSEGGLGR